MTPPVRSSWGDPVGWMLVLVWAVFAAGVALWDRTVGLPANALEIAILLGAIPFLYLFAWAAARSAHPEAGAVELRRHTRRILLWIGGFFVVTGAISVLALWLSGEFG